MHCRDVVGGAVVTCVAGMSVVCVMPSRDPSRPTRPPSRDTVAVLKRQVAHAIVRTVDGWTQANAAVLLGIDQPRVSDLRNARLERFSLDQLVTLLTRADASVALTISAHPQRRRWLFEPPA